VTAQQQDRLDVEPVHVPGDGPHDVEDLDPEVTLAAGTVDFGAVRVPLPEHGTVDVDPAEKGRMQAVHVSVPEGRLSVSALAAPRSSRLWPDLVTEIDASLREGGARVRSFQGDWGRELHATSGAATSLFVGVDGARWMLYGVATGPTRDAGALDEQLRRMLRGTIVVRGRSPYPVRTVLPLEVPEHLVTSVPQVGGSVVELRPPAGPAATPPGTPRPPTRPRPAAPPMAGSAAAEVSPPTTALPLRGGAAARRSGDAAAPTTALPVPPPRAEPVHRVAGRPAGLGPDDRPTDIRPATPGAQPTGRRRLHQPDEPRAAGDRERSPSGSTAVSPDGRAFAAGSGRLRPADTGAGTATPGGPGPAAGPPDREPTGRRRRPDPAPTEALPAVPDVLRVGRHAAAEPAPERNGRAAPTRPWPASRPTPASGPVTGTTPWPAGSPASEPGLVTEPLPRPASERPTGRHHRLD
jgi:hypothetical protein